MIDISSLSHKEAIALLKKIDDIVGDLPSFIEYDRDAGYFGVYEPYSCCTGNTREGHDKDCGIGNLKEIFGN